MIRNLTEDTFLLFAMHVYENPHCRSMDEFKEDLNRPKYLKRLFSRYRLNGILRERLILNHIIIMRNMFGIEGAVRILFYTIDEVFWNILKPFVVYLNYMPDTVKMIRGRNIRSAEIDSDKYIVNKLKELDENSF